MKVDKGKFEDEARVTFSWKNEMKERVEKLLKDKTGFHSRSCHDIHSYASTKVYSGTTVIKQPIVCVERDIHGLSANIHKGLCVVQSSM